MTPVQTLGIPYFLHKRLRPRRGCSFCSRRVRRDSVVPLLPIHPGDVTGDSIDVKVCYQCRRALRLLNARWASIFEDMEHIIADSTRRWVMYDEVLNLSEVSLDGSLPIRVYSLLADARRSFVFGATTSAIVMASAAVELALNVDDRRGSRVSRWSNLNMATIRQGASWGAPVDLLLDSTEQSLGVLQVTYATFLQRRNKAAHGDHVPNTVDPLIDPRAFESEAATQLRFAQGFLFKWALQDGNPVIGGARRNEEGKSVIPMGVHLSALRLAFFNEYALGRWF